MEACTKAVSCVELGHIYSEVHNTAFFGVPSGLHPLLVAPDQIDFFEHIPNDAECLQRANPNPVLFSAVLMGEGRLPFFGANTCMLVDRIATLLGGVRARTTRISGIVSWPSKRPVIAEKHLLLCLLFIAGQSGYSLNLTKQARRARGGCSGPVAIGFTSTSFSSGDKDKKNFFTFCFLRKGCLLRDDIGFMCPPEEGNELTFLVFDPCSWKNIVQNHPVKALLNVSQTTKGRPVA